RPAKLDRYAFDNRLDPRRRDDAFQPETGSGEQFAELLFGPFHSTGEHKHLQIHELGNAWLIAARHYLIHHQQPATGTNPLAAMAENLNALRIVPIVNDVLHDVHIGARRDAFKEAACLQLAPVAEMLEDIRFLRA